MNINKYRIQNKETVFKSVSGDYFNQLFLKLKNKFTQESSVQTGVEKMERMNEVH